MRLTGGQIILKYLEKEKVPYILGIPGHGILGFFDAVREADAAGKIKYLQVKHEQTALHIADGYFRIKGEPLAVFTSIGPGALNTAIGLGTAYVDSTAIFQVSGDTHVHMKGVGVLQEIERYQDSNFIRSLEPLTKRSWRAESVNQVPRMMQRAFNQMMTGRKGPVMLSVPMDVQADSIDVELAEPIMHKAGAGPAGDQAMIDAAVEVMKNAKRPVILAGGAMLRSGCHKKLVELAELWGAAVVTTMAGKSAFPEDHPLYGFHTGSKGTPVGIELTRNADVVLALGTRFADETTCSYRKGIAFNFPQTKLIHVDIEAGEIGKTYGTDVGILGDLSIVIDQLVDTYQKKVSSKNDYMQSGYTKEILKLKEDWSARLDAARAKKFDKITISQLIGKMGQCLSDDTIIATSSGNTQAQLFQEYCFKTTQTHLTTGGFSTMGWAFPAAIGAKLAKPDAPVVAFMGDGDFMMVMQELSTIAQLNIPIVVLLVNNSGWLAINDLQHAVYGKDATFGNDWIKDGELYTPDFAEIAKNFGIYSQKISQESEVEGALKTAFEQNAPAFIEVDVYREYPESGGEAFGWWDVPVPTYMEELRKKYEMGAAEEQV